jgi:NADH:ubiquinone oxidoreductase subunit K
VDDLLLNQFLLLGAVLFCVGVYGVLAKRNAVLVLMSVELILNAVNINLIAFGALAAEVGVGLAIVLLIYRNRRSVDLNEIDLMKG